MWYTSRPIDWSNSSRSPPGTLSGEVRLALSSDGRTWRRIVGPSPEGAVFPPNSEEWWAFDTVHVSTGSVLLTSPARVRSDAGVYTLYYSGGDTEHLPISNDLKIPGARTRIGVAISKDGEHFTRIEGQFPSGAVLDVAEQPSFDDLFVAAPCVIYCPHARSSLSSYVMYYHGATTSNKQFAIGRAESQDAIKFTRSPLKTPVLSSEHAPEGATWADGGVCRPCVLRRKNDDWVMFVEVIGADGVHRIGKCDSSNGIKWGELQVVLDVGQRGEWDDAGVSHPYALMGEDEETVQLFYTGRRDDHDVENGRGTCICMAESHGSDWTRFSRVSGDP